MLFLNTGQKKNTKEADNIIAEVPDKFALYPFRRWNTFNCKLENYLAACMAYLAYHPSM